MLDRTIAPPSYKIKQHKFSQPDIYFINDDVPMHVLSMGTQPIVQIELIFDSGVWYETSPGVAYFTANMLLEGTKNRSSQEIAEVIDLYGAMLEVKVKPDTTSLILCSMTKFLEPMLELLLEILSIPAFEEDRLQHLKQLKIHDIAIDDAKVNRVAKKIFRSILYSPDHPYGRSLNNEDVNAIVMERIIDYYENSLFLNSRILVSGLLSHTELATITRYLDSTPRLTSKRNKVDHIFNSRSNTNETIIQKNGLQAAICMGKVLFEKTHEDFIQMLIVNTILGGYFGSRLMRNIREKNGYTYGIHSQITPLQHSGYLLVVADVAEQYSEATCLEIEKEIEILQTTHICKTELKTLKNYLKGMLMANTDNPLAVMDRFKSAYLYGLDEEYFDTLYDTIYNIDEEQILNIANKHLALDTMNCIIVK